MTWDDFMDLVATILIGWMVVAVLAGILIGKFCKAGQGPDEESSDEG